MAIGRDKSYLRELRALFDVGALGELTDGQLLERFVTVRGEAAELAFELLVERHGPMVLRVCRGVLADSHEAQDAFQATFLVLVGKARTLWVRDSIGPWLHQVAYRTAACARSAALRRRRHERAAAERKKEEQVETRDELGQVLHEEINRLPERFRAPLVLCDLEGGTHEQAARHLGWPVGTVKSRLSRGRDRLRDQLFRRGLAPSVWPLAPALKLEGVEALVFPALVQSTIRVASQFVIARTVLRESAAILAQEVLRTMTLIRTLKAASVLLVVAATASGVDLLAQKEEPVVPARPAGVADALSTIEVKRGPLKRTLNERGVIEATHTPTLINKVAEPTSIVSIVPDGSLVKKGDLVCELDSAVLRDQLTNQRLVVSGAERAYQKGKLGRELAESALDEYAQGIYVQEREALLGVIEIGQSAIQKAKGRLERTRQARERLNNAKPETKTSADLVTEVELDNRIDESEQTLLRERKGVELAKAKLEVLERFTRDKTIRLLKIDIETAQDTELTKHQFLDKEKKKQEYLEAQIDFCKLYAPTDGLLVHANLPGGIEQGTSIMGRQNFVRVDDLDQPFRLHAKAKEAYVHQLRPGLRVRIKVDAFPDQVMTGLIESVAPRPAPRTAGQQSDTKVYDTIVIIENRPRGLRPGMTALAEIFVLDLDDVLSVPLQAVRRDEENDYVAVKKPDGDVDWREVTLGESDGWVVEIKRGLKSGERVADRAIDVNWKKPNPLP
ncbi:RND family efflux transporter, MFP subunit [Singulisphaera sp. GP187]|uniref:sigma-70 family RNA polymerase sigma factor n=1 Tax=Singulisphaera sp. GP187 TaxID=1882752 RepID=UPI000927D247|nr:sigma-70 family RNA polymerase sigma factor [Singulisphaera sp. GP187]SIN75870.1 RND family efflux transporter, MFP subunit [Singulisphaera sp. GP187]